jgi:hypothetical protein
MLRSLSLLALGATLVPSLASAAEAPAGKVILEARLRYEGVSQDGFGKDAQALTLRTRLGYETPAFHGVKALVEGENITAFDDRYNSSTNGKTTYPLVTDPETTELNRAQLSWTGAQGEAVLGRQRLILNNARFVGNVGFRQNEQTFDALKLVYRASPTVSLTYAYLDKVHRIFGEDHPQGNWRSDSHLMQVDAKTSVGQVSAYGYLLDFANAPTQSSATWGVRLVGSRPLANGLAATYEAEYARQSDYRNSPTRFDLDYVGLSAGVRMKTSSLALGLERLDGDGRRGFQTPLATLHAFQGWDDVFLTTPAKGVRDLNLTAATSLTGPHARPVKLQAALHRFDDADGATDFGQELDASISTPLTPHVSTELKAAVFQSDLAAFPDRTKIWLSFEFKL